MLIFLLLVLLASGCEVAENENGQPKESPVEEVNLKAYLPLQPGMVFDFAGGGVAFPSLEREVMFADEPYFQILDKTTGTNIVALYELREDQIGVVFEEGEFYSEENLLEELEEEPEIEEIILKRPVEPGTSWQTNDQQKEITAVDETVTVPAGTFYDVIEVKITPLENENNYTNYHYYAKNIGLIKRESFGRDDNRLTILELESYEN